MRYLLPLMLLTACSITQIEHKHYGEPKYKEVSNEEAANLIIDGINSGKPITFVLPCDDGAK